MSDNTYNESDPKMSRKHLNIEQREYLYQLQSERNLSRRQMAALLGCHQSTVSRELKRNLGALGVYLPATAQAKSGENKRNDRSRR